MNITGKTTIYRNEWNDKVLYSASLSKKVGEEWENGYINVSFKKGVDVPDKTKIDITNGFITFYKKDKQTIPTLFILDFNADDPIDKVPDFVQVEDDLSELPF